MSESVNARTDAQMPARVQSYKLTIAFGSGELKKTYADNSMCTISSTSAMIIIIVSREQPGLLWLACRTN